MPGLDQLPPNDIDAEEAVLGSILLGAWAPKWAEPDDYIIFLKPIDFYREQNAWVFAAMRSLLQKGWPIDQITLAHHLGQENHLEAIGGPPYLSSLIGRVPTPLHVVYYAKIVKDMAIRRRKIEQGGHLAAEGYEGSTKKSPVSTTFDL